MYHSLRIALLAVVALASAAAATQGAGSRPNVILLLTDDQGYGDLSCHGHPYLKTPHIDELHADSVRLTDFHVDPTCSPSRAALMTGRYSSRSGVWHTLQGRSIMRRDETTIAQIFAANGYRTGIFGKWHLGDTWPYRPKDRGFQETLIHGGGGVGQNPDYWGNKYFDDTYRRSGQPERVEGYCTDVWFREAIKFIGAHRDRPFFCYLATNAPHFWHYVPEKYSAPYRALGMEEERARFFGMIACIDENLAQLRQRLREWGIDDNTILVFMTDNGHSGYKMPATSKFAFNAGMRGFKSSQYDGGHRVPCFIRWPAGGITGGRDVPQLTAHFDILPTLVDLCGLQLEPRQPLDGMSLAPLLRGNNAQWPDRTLFVHHQRLETPVKGRNWSAMTDRWRLVDGKELYDIQADPRQRQNVSESHPKVVQRLQTAYDAWWRSISTRFDEFCPVVVGSEEENPVELTCHDWHSDRQLATWDPAVIDRGEQGNGFWAVEVARAGTYEFRLQALPDEAHEKRPLDAVRARVRLGDEEVTAKVPEGAASLVVRMALAAGEMRMQTWLETADGSNRGAPFVYVTFLGPASP